MSKTPITYLKEHHDTFRKYHRPLFDVDYDNNLVAVNFSPMFEGPLDVAVEDVRPFYAAYTKWHAMVKDNKYHIEHKLEPGDIITFNNRRVLHGRTSFGAHESRLLIVSSIA